MFLRSMLTIPSGSMLTIPGGDKWPKEYNYPFKADNFIKDWSTLFPADFTLNASKQCIQSNSNYNVSQSHARGYLKIHTPNFSVKFTFTGYTSSERSYDWGSVYVSTSTANLENGTQVYKGSGSNSSPSSYSTTLNANTDYYINFTYRKDSSGNSGDDRFYIYGLKFERA